MDSSSEFSNFAGHGGDLASAARRFGVPKGGWLDLSTGINPFAYPYADFAASALTRLPSADGLAELLNAARTYYRVPDGAAVAAANGTQQIIQVLPRLIAGERVAIKGPTYSEHALAWARAGRTVVSEGPSEIAVVVNPNNPDGRIHEDLPEAAAVIVDEAFGDVAPQTSFVSRSAEDGVIILKSFGKFFGLAGLRLGFCVSGAPFADRMADELGPWSVSGPALEIGARALSDRAWIEATRDRLAQARWDLERILMAAGFEIVGGTDLFCLTAHPQARSIHEHLGRSGILVRAFANRSDWLRFGLPGAKANLARLEAALGDYVRSSR